MPRKLRVEYEGAIYHVINRGDRREPIFLDDTDRNLFLETLGQACQKTGWKIARYLVMGRPRTAANAARLAEKRKART